MIKTIRERNLEHWDKTMTYCCTLLWPTCAAWMVLCSPGQMEQNRSIFWLLKANTSKCSFHTAEHMGFQWCTKLNHAVLRYFLCSNHPYYGWWFYFMVNKAAAAKLQMFAPQFVPKNAAQVDALLECTIRV